MKRTYTIFNIVFLTLILFLTASVKAQIVGLDVSKYYMIQTARGGAGMQPALGINSTERDNDEALLEKQTADGFSNPILWQIIQVSDNTYRFKNKNSGMALGRTTWRGKRPDITDPADVWNFDAWAGHPPHFGACQRIWNEDDPSQVWIPVKFDASYDPPRYQMTNADQFNDSTWSFNLWRGDSIIHTGAEAYQNKNIALADGELEEPDKFSNPTGGYAYIFTVTVLDVPASALNENLNENIHVYSHDGSIILQGELQGKQVEVYSILGSRIYAGLADASELNIAVKRGLYVVKAGSLITKLVVE